MGKPLKFGIQTSSSSTMDGAEKAPLLMMLIDKSSMNTTCLRQVATILSKKFGPTSFFYLLRESVYYDCVLYGKGSPSKTGFLKLHKENLYSWVFKYLLLLSLSIWLDACNSMSALWRLVGKNKKRCLHQHFFCISYSFDRRTSTRVTGLKLHMRVCQLDDKKKDIPEILETFCVFLEPLNLRRTQ